VINLSIKYYLPSSSGSLIIAIKPYVKNKFRKTVTLLASHRGNVNRSGLLSGDLSSHRTPRTCVIYSDNVPTTSQVRISAMAILLII